MLFLRHFSRCGSNRGWGQKGIPMPVLSFGAIVQRSFASVARRMKTKRAREEHQKWVHRMQRQRVIEKPWRKQGKLCTQPSLLYASAKLRAQKGMHDRKTSFLSLIVYRKNFDNLSAEERAPFIAQAAANRTARLRARARIKNLRISTYALFLKQNFKSTAVGVAGDSIREKLPMISRAIAKRWKAMSLRRKHEYRTEAQLLREKANKNLDLLMKGK